MPPSGVTSGTDGIAPARAQGTVNQNVVPTPGVLSTPMCPPSSSTIRREIARPRPVPPNRLVVEASACVKASNSLACACGEMPMPVSLTSTRSTACPSCAGGNLERLLSLPAVQSEGTRRLALQAAQKRDAAHGRDRMHEQLRYEQTHDRHG